MEVHRTDTAKRRRWRLNVDDDVRTRGSGLKNQALLDFSSIQTDTINHGQYNSGVL